MSDKNGHVTLTVDEIISALQHSSLPTVIIEGKDDLLVFRGMENEFFDIGLSIMPVGGRCAVLEIFKRRFEINNLNKLAFIADQDSWIISGIPQDYLSERLLFTNGYSIENDVYIDGDLERLLNKNEHQIFLKELKLFMDWYAIAIDRFMSGVDQKLDVHPNALLDDKVERAKLMNLQADEVYPAQLRIELEKDYLYKIRGKSLIAVLMRQLSYKGRAARHNDKSILENVATRPGPLLHKFNLKIKNIFYPEIV